LDGLLLLPMDGDDGGDSSVLVDALSTSLEWPA
jgi:hypothetical protein